LTGIIIFNRFPCIKTFVEMIKNKLPISKAFIETDCTDSF